MSSKLYRIVQMDQLIRCGNYPNVATFRQQFEVSERTVHHDLDFFRDSLRAPLVYHRTRRGYYYTDPTWSLPAILVSEGELLSFFLSIELTRRYLGTTFEEPLRNAVEKLAANLPSELHIDLNQLVQHYSFGTGATAIVDPQLLTDLHRAISERRPMQVTYFTPSRNALTERTLHPYHLHNVRGDWQLIAFDSYRQRVLTFAVERIRTWKVISHECFQWQQNFVLDDYLASQFISERVDEPIEFVIWFDSYQACYIRERRWHATQQPLEEHVDGSVTLRITAGSMGEMQRWVLAFGSHARVIAPLALRQAVQAELRAALQYYETD